MGVAGASAMASCLSLGVLNEIRAIDLNRISIYGFIPHNRQFNLRWRH